MATGSQSDIFSRLRGSLPASWFPEPAPVADALLNAPAWALSSNYAQIAYAKLQTRIATATDMWLDVISNDFFNGTLPRAANEGDGAFRARIQANLFVKGPTRGNMKAVLTLLTGRAPTIVEPSNPNDTGALDTTTLYWDAAGCMGDALPYQSFVTAYRPIGSAQDIGEWDTYRSAWDAYGGWSDLSVSGLTDAAIIAAVEATRPLGYIVWLRIANNPVTP